MPDLAWGMAQLVHKRLTALVRAGVFFDKPISLLAMEKFPPAVTPPVSRTHRLKQERIAQRQVARPFQRSMSRIGLEPVRARLAFIPHAITHPSFVTFLFLLSLQALTMPPPTVLSAKRSIPTYGDSDDFHRKQFEDRVEASGDPFEHTSAETDDVAFEDYRARLRAKWESGLRGPAARAAVDIDMENESDLEDTRQAVAMAEVRTAAFRRK